MLAEGFYTSPTCSCFTRLQRVLVRHWKMFDTTNHDISLQKLKHYGIVGNAFDWFRDYVCGRKQCVRVDNITSELKPCPTGVPQGSILDPILFLLYVNEFTQYIGNQNCNIFADDAMIYSFGNGIIENEANLQNALDSLSPWYTSNMLNISTIKSYVMLVGKHSQVHDASISINTNDVPLEQVNVFLLTAHCHWTINTIIVV